MKTLFTQPAPPIPPAAALHATYLFVQKCRAYAVAQVETRRESGRHLAEWESYLRFTDHTLRELENGTLDHWFAAEESSAP